MNFFSSDYDSQSKNGRKLIIKGICGNCLLMVKQILLIMIKIPRAKQIEIVNNTLSMLDEIKNGNHSGVYSREYESCPRTDDYTGDQITVSSTTADSKAGTEKNIQTFLWYGI